MKIDNINIFKNTLHIRGWTNLGITNYSNGEFSVEINGTIYNGIAVIERREDLEQAFGGKSSNWGFLVAFVLPSENLTKLASSDGIYRFRKEIYENPARALSAHYNNGTIFNEFKNLIQNSSVKSPSFLEIGSRARSGNIYNFGQEFDYCGFDIQEGENVDIVGDVHKLSKYIDRKFEFCASISVWEHLAMPWKAAVELAKTINVGGLAYIQSHQTWALHDAPWDFFRYSKDAWKCIFNHKTGWEILGTEQCLPTYLVPTIETNNQSLQFGQSSDAETNVGYLMSSCLIKRNTYLPTLEWEVELSDLLHTSYPS